MEPYTRGPWQPAIEEALADSETCAVLIGPSGLSPWQREEMRLAINRRVSDSQQRFRVVPVLLPGAKRDSLPALLVAGTWVEFRDSIDEPDALPSAGLRDPWRRARTRSI
jgi:TIR domain